MRKDTILVVGSNGQIGSVLVKALRSHFGTQNVIASDIRMPSQEDPLFEPLDALNRHRLNAIVDQYQVTQIYHLAAILSAKGEAQPLNTWDINMNCLFNVLEIAREKNLDKVFFPSTIAVFGSNTPRINTPQDTIRTPETVYGMSKVAGENWCAYYHRRYGLDVRSVRYPGIIGYQSLPGGGTTDYAVDIFYKAVRSEPYVCFLKENTRLPMMYMDDAIRATVELMEAPAANLSVRTSYNLAGMSFTPAELAAEIAKHKPGFQVTYEPDFRQAIAESWTESIDDSTARNDWGWKPAFDLAKMTEDMLLHLY